MYNSNNHQPLTTVMTVSFIFVLVACGNSRKESSVPANYGLKGDFKNAEDKSTPEESARWESSEETGVNITANASGYMNGSGLATNPGAASFTITAGDANSTSAAASGPNQFIPSSAAVEDKNDTVHKFVRTADMRFRVKEVTQSTYVIEDIVKYFGGWVTDTRLHSNINNVQLTPVSRDSSLETTYFTVENRMILRVPNTNLDTTLKTIARQIDFMNYRIIKATDVSLQMYSKFLEQKRLRDYDERMKKAIDTRGTKLKETSTAEDNILSRQQQADNAKIETLSLLDQINYSTINLEIYQRQSIRRELIANNKNIEAYKPSFSSRMKEAFQAGYRMAQEIVIFITNLWVVILLLAVAGVILYRWLRTKKV